MMRDRGNGYVDHGPSRARPGHGETFADGPVVMHARPVGRMVGAWASRSRSRPDQ